MTDNVYRPPETELIQSDSSVNNKFYIVSKTKFSVLYITTVGIYLLYWFYVNWKNYKKETGQRMLPLARAIFAIFFTHALFKAVDTELKSKSLSYNWSPGGLATLYVLLSIASFIIDKLAQESIGSPFTDVVSLILIPAIILFIFLKAQGAINLSQDDKHGDSNSQFTLYNYLWMIPGILLWVVIAIGFTQIV